MKKIEYNLNEQNNYVLLKTLQGDAKDLAQDASNVCFVAGTLIHTIHRLKPIETINHGDLIWSRQEFGTLYGYRPVIATKVTPNQEIYEVVVKHDNDNTIEVFKTTAEHPFWVEGIGYLKASLLEKGMILIDKHGFANVTIISQRKLANTETVYNFEVQDFHTYHIGKCGVWVHNANCCDVIRANLEDRYGKLDDRHFGANSEIYWRNPLTNKNEQINKIATINGKQYVKDPLTGNLEDATKYTVGVDHILPQSYFTKDPPLVSYPKKYGILS
ncbi:polymorphic toxin-type HINT domain-containing protein [Moraxella cuniculi]|uniref:Protein of uncharacterized function (DUF1557) n=1 Tax=Moraxella cuniculi TaxID=34061 RepID=A0A448GWK0_9GAMM|nr:polymorphic toxin-type HINT domain-containing protein [Moraxella cuniculi]VEG13176.1 Protein of uncharacterised function (DUF1557) [Moraxella cuniculi]